MPQKHVVASLQDLALLSVGEWVKMVGRGLIEPTYLITQKDQCQGQLFLVNTLSYVRELLYTSVPRYLHDQMANQVLTSTDELINETKSSYNNFCPMAVFLNKMKVVVSLTEVVMHPMLKQLDVYHWPKIMRHVMNQNLSKLVGLERLNLGSGSAGWDTSEAEKHILSGVQWMSNLTHFCLCFDCTNTIIMTLGNNCPSLQSLDVTSSRSVTDRSIRYLLQCKRLKEVKLYRTSVSVTGYCDLLSGLPNIQDIGRCDELGRVLISLEEMSSEPLPLLALQCRDLTEDQLKLLVTYCPRLNNLSIFHDERIADLTVLSALNDLTDLKILNCDFFTDHVKELLEQRGKNLNSLSLEHVDEIDLNALIAISQYCPNLKILSFVNCEFGNHRTLLFNLKKLAVHPFAYLEKLLLVADCDREHLEFLMAHCKNIRMIQLGSSTGIDNATFCRVLGQNSMHKLEELRILFSFDLNMEFIRLLMSYCKNLRKLTELESWEGITPLELQHFRTFIRANNIDLNTKPTLYTPN
ncbi:F-box/LRR-repeat protein 7-like isoform X1 [Macrosteles quadrilineatus]|uniref:F-box/LRR-repeat protein 7-like isoform X1 n=1 Tax=Macrosteles quadrilineatus TaxID=74068 RepID=UPI0023E1D270|nr:F-box/LRR-repeat protein 7-like isoform X1 [Macrosteles quadrilineatus]